MWTAGSSLRGAVALVPDPWRLGPRCALPGGDLLGKVEPDEPAPGLCLGLQRLDVEISVRRMGDDGVGHALLANEHRQRARVDAGNGDDAAGGQPLVEMHGGTMVRRIGEVGLENRAYRSGAVGRVQILDVLVVGADIADVREGEGDDLAGVGGIGEDLLIAGERGVEADLADGLAGGAEAVAFDDRSVGKHQKRGRPVGNPGRGLVGHCVQTPSRIGRDLEQEAQSRHMTRLKDAGKSGRKPRRPAKPYVLSAEVRGNTRRHTSSQ